LCPPLRESNHHAPKKNTPRESSWSGFNPIRRLRIVLVRLQPNPAAVVVCINPKASTQASTLLPRTHPGTARCSDGQGSIPIPVSYFLDFFSSSPKKGNVGLPPSMPPAPPCAWPTSSTWVAASARRRGSFLRTSTPWSPHRHCWPRASQLTQGHGRNAEAVVISGGSETRMTPAPPRSP
jgi:hypothetical protein